MSLQITTPRLRLVAADVSLARAELYDRTAFTRMVGARVPEDWPPELMVDALPFFLQALEADAASTGWMNWYVVVTADELSEPVLAGSAGFKGPPDHDGRVEIGYSLLPGYHGHGYATEMAGALIDWARSTGRVRVVLAQTLDSNGASRRVLEKLGFVPMGPGDEAESTIYELTVVDE